MTKLTPEEILYKLQDGFNDRSGCSEITYVADIIEDAKHNAWHEGGITDDQLDILDGTLEQVIEAAQSARNYLAELRSGKVSP
jgi:hypothetical protein